MSTLDHRPHGIFHQEPPRTDLLVLVRLLSAIHDDIAQNVSDPLQKLFTRDKVRGTQEEQGGGPLVRGRSGPPNSDSLLESQPVV